MANEFKIKNGLIVSGSTEIEQDLTVYGTFIANNIVSGSSQISFNGITDKPTLVSGSSQIIISGTTGYSTFSSSIDSTISASISSLSASIAVTDLSDDARLDSLESASGSIRTDFNSFTSSYTTVSGSLDSRLDVLEAYSGSQLVPSSSMSFRTLQTDVYCKNVTGVQINKGTVVRIVGATGDNPLIAPASLLTEGDSANTLGIATQNIPNDDFGLVITEGVLIGVNTSGMTAGDLLFLGANGTFTTTPPAAPNHGVRLGEVLRVQQNQGSIYVRIDNGMELNEAHDVTYSSISHGDLLVRSGSVWKNNKTLNGDYTVTGSLTITQNLTVLGSSSITYVTASQLAVSSSIISVNVFEPAERFGGLKVYDSGSSTATASLLWDSEHNHWIYQNVSGANYSGGMLLSGPRNTGSLGDEPGLINGRIVKSIGGDHLDVSIISETGTTITIAGDLVANSITGAFDFSGLVNKPTLVSGSSQIDVMSTTNIARLATTGSNIFIGNQTITGSLNVTGSIVPGANNLYDLGSPTNQFRHLYLSSASLYIDGTKVLGSTAQELQITTDTGQSFKILEAGSDTITLQSADGNITLTSSGGGDVIMDPNTGIIALKGTTTLYSGNKIVSSDGNSIQFGNGIAITGSIVSTATPLVSGSSQISFTGLSNIPSGIVSGSSQVLSGTGIWSGSAQLPSGVVSGSSQVLAGTTIHSGSFFNGISVVSGSAQIDVTSTTNIARLATTGSNSFTGTQTFGYGRLVASGHNSSAQITINANYDGGQTNTYTPDYAGDGSAGMFLMKQSNGGYGDFYFYGKQHGTTGGSHALSTFNQIMGMNVNGRVAIGKLNANAPLDVNGNTLVTGSITSTGNISAGTTFNWNSGVGALSYNTGVVTMETNSATRIELKTNGTTAVTINTGQTVNFSTNVGIRTSVFGEYLNIGNGGAIGWQNTSSAQKWHIQYNTSNDGLNFVESGVADYRLFLKAGGAVGIGDQNPQSGLYIAKYGSKFDADSQYNQPSGNVFLSMGYSVANQDNWFGLRGNYASTSGTANLLLQANYRDVGSQAGHYVSSNALTLATSYFAIGKLVTTTSVSTPPNKVEQLIITSAGTLQVKPNTIGTSDTADRSIIVGSRPSNSTIASLGFDTGGSNRGDFDFNGSDGTFSYWYYNGSSWNERWRTPSSGGITVYGAGFTITEPGVSSFSISYSSGKTQFGMDSAGTDGFYFRSYSSGAYADRFIIKSSGEVNVRGAILPTADATYNLGSTSLRWNNLYTTDLHLSNEGKQNIVDGTWGDWTLQEGENDIFMLNNRNGEKFKIKLEKIV